LPEATKASVTAMVDAARQDRGSVTGACTYTESARPESKADVSCAGKPSKRRTE
jgi:hypothetical protein